jgi:hypothetical protein
VPQPRAPTGALSLWKGIAPALLRQFLYTGLRMGIYEPIRNFFAFGGTKASDAPLLTKILAGTDNYELSRHCGAVIT